MGFIEKQIVGYGPTVYIHIYVYVPLNPFPFMFTWKKDFSEYFCDFTKKRWWNKEKTLRLGRFKKPVLKTSEKRKLSVFVKCVK